LNLFSSGGQYKGETGSQNSTLMLPSKDLTVFLSSQAVNEGGYPTSGKLLSEHDSRRARGDLGAAEDARVSPSATALMKRLVVDRRGIALTRRAAAGSRDSL
jgi:hypothetical protein